MGAEGRGGGRSIPGEGVVLKGKFAG